VIAARVVVPPFTLELEASLLQLGYATFVNATGLGCLASRGAPPSHPNAHVFFIPHERLDALVARGIVAPRTDEAEARAGRSDDAVGDAWRALPFVVRFGLEQHPMPESVVWALRSRDATLGVGARVAARRAALDADPHPLTRLTAARLSCEELRTSEAADILGPLTEPGAWAASSSTVDRAFLPARADDEAPPEVRLEAWLEGQAVSAFVHAAAPTGFHQSDGVLGMLARVETLGMSTPSDDRRVGLCLARRGAR
jgi:hypothetical protein